MDGPEGRCELENGLSEVPDAAAIEEWLACRVSEMMHLDRAHIDVRRPFAYFGLSSAEGVILAGDIERWLGCGPLAPTLAWDFPTIESLARHLAAGKRGGEDSAGASAAESELEEILSEIEELPDE